MDEEQRERDDIEDEEEELPIFDLEQLSRRAASDEPGVPIFIEDQTIPDLGKILAFAHERKRPVAVEGSIIEKACLTLAPIPLGVELDIEETIFVEDFQCAGVVFDCGLRFCDVTFQARLDFQGAVFHSKVLFDDCEFLEEVDFSGARFKGEVSFSCCDFDQPARFDGARFKGRVNLDHSTFQQALILTDCTFPEPLDLERICCEAGVDLNGSNQQALIAGSTPKKPQKSSAPKSAASEKKPFNPWRELDRVSKKDMSRRQLLRGLFRFLPEKKEE